MHRNLLPAAFCSIAAASAMAAPSGEPVKTLGTVTVIGNRPTSLPTQIPTTIEGVTAEDIADTINSTDAQDALKYFPSLLVRKRYVGDYDHAVLATRASGTNNSARSMVYADGILISNLLGNGASFTPRWGMVTPEEIDRVDVLYGPFSAAYPGNSVGAVVDYVTRMPAKFEAHVRTSSFGEDFSVYSTHDRYTGWQASASVGDRVGNWSWWLNYNRLDSDAHPITYANKLVSAGTAVTNGTPVSGALDDRNPRNQDWLILGATNATHTIQDHAKAKVAYDFTPTLRASYMAGWWRNDADRSTDSYLRDAAGNTIYGGNIVVNGRQYALLATDFAPSTADLQHLMQGVSLRSRTNTAWDWEVAASRFDYSKDLLRVPTVFLPAARAGGAGRIADQDGTGWNAVSLKASWRPQGMEGAHLVDLGVQRDSYKLRTRVDDTNDWRNGPAIAPVSAFGGESELTGWYAQDTWRFASSWRATLGLRAEQWRASDGSIATGNARPLSFPTREETWLSPKAAIAWQLSSQWVLKASAGRDFRSPTVSELYQGSIVAGSIVNNDPDLDPEKSWTGELTAERALEHGLVRTTVFHEDTHDALYSQVNVATGGTVTTIQNVGRIRTTGVEIASQMADLLLPGFDLSGSVTYARSRIVENDAFPASVGKWQPRVPEWRANLLASWHATDRLVATLGARYSGTQYNTLDNGDPNGFTYTGTSSFFVADVRARYRVTPQISASLGVDNLNNKEYWAFHPYTQRTLMAEVGVDF